MLENFTYTDWLVIILLSLFISAIILIPFSILFKLKHRMEDLSRMMYVLIKKDEHYNNSHDDIKRALTVINGNIGSLSSSTDRVHQEIQELTNTNKQTLNELKVYSTKAVLPTPNISKMMRETILENINIEVLLSKGMSIPNKKSTEHIIANTIKTYPDVDQEYTVKLCLAMIENFALNVKEGRKNV